MDLDIMTYIVKHLEKMLQDRDLFEQRFGKKATVFLDHLPPLYRLYHRLTFEMNLPANLRYKSAAVAIYIAEHQDFIGEGSRGIEGLIDDVWIAFRMLQELLEKVPEDIISDHWRSEIPFDEVAALAPNISSLDEVVPPRVLTLARKFLDLEEK